MFPSELVAAKPSLSDLRVQFTLAEVQSSTVQDARSSLTAQEITLVMVPLCFVAAWAALAYVISDTWKTSRKKVESNSSLSQSPCKKCRFFNSNPYIKCAVNPHIAMTKAAQDCADYQPRSLKN
ncbi:MAG: hypothetical protein HC780_06895 [Leptolyngbyaceae cyanobacterium CSU_1_3]|nr:hypothetical protein [Leptolyngbyaceae cyanobacterium CSU_1_3]